MSRKRPSLAGWATAPRQPVRERARGVPIAEGAADGATSRNVSHYTVLSYIAWKTACGRPVSDHYGWSRFRPSRKMLQPPCDSTAGWQSERAGIWLPAGVRRWPGFCGRLYWQATRQTGSLAAAARHMRTGQLQVANDVGLVQQ